MKIEFRCKAWRCEYWKTGNECTVCSEIVLDERGYCYLFTKK